jgi:hypothetical protein
VQLLLIDDLPLFWADCPADTQGAVEAAIAPRASGLTRSLMPYADLVRWWSGVTAATAGTAGTAVLVGTRPRLLHRLRPLTASAVRNEMVVRRHAPDGRTADATAESSRPLVPTGDGSVTVIDDVAMSGRTVCSVLALLGPEAPPGGLTVRIAVATREALRFNAGHRHRPRFQVDRLLDFEPIAEGTVIFLNDLLFGTLRGGPFLDQEELLMPLFPEGVAVWRGLADHVRSRAGARWPEGATR